jgi:hypothetical protein
MPGHSGILAGGDVILRIRTSEKSTMSTIAATNAPATNAVASLLSNAAGFTVESDKAVSKQTGRAVTLASDDPKAKPSNEPSVVVTLSSAAKAASPSSAPAQKDFTAVTSEARAALDAAETSMGAAGTPFDLMHMSADQATAMTSGLDRRSLYAVASNSGGLFSKDEQDLAQIMMRQQQQQAMTAADPTQTNPAAAYKAGVAFLDSVSPEEKAGSFEWAQQRAAGQYGYESAMHQKGEEPENLDSDSPVVKMLKGAMDALRSLNDASKKLEDMPQYKQAQAAFGAGGNTAQALDVTA